MDASVPISELNAALREQFELGVDAGVESIAAALEGVIAAQRGKGQGSLSLDLLQGVLRDLTDHVAKRKRGSE